jgi:A/G-specific adenine glycosylase
LQSLPRIDLYAARARLCFAFGEPLAIVDTNVATVVEDTLGYDSARRAHKDGSLYDLLNALILDRPDPARVFNLALIDMPAPVCEQNREERDCPFGSVCTEDSTSIHSPGKREILDGQSPE